jgi:hypothetical protein
MSWIKDNPFIATLGGITVAATGALVFVGSHASSTYQTHLDSYTENGATVTDAAKGPLYPTADNVRGKRKALADYRESLLKLQESFSSYRPTELKKLSGQDFTGNLKAADAKVREAFTASKTTIPEAFFLGFEAYKGGALAKEGATGILDYQLGASTDLFLALAKAAPSELKNVYRKELVEETGATFTPDSRVYRPLPMEITFTGTENSVRTFLSSLASSDTYYYNIRSIRINNARETGPSPADAKFEAPKPAAGTPGSDPFGGGGFVIPVAEPAAPAAPASGATPAPAAPAAPAATAAPESGRILQQVLGMEELTVFIRFDVCQFLPVKELPKP